MRTLGTVVAIALVAGSQSATAQMSADSILSAVRRGQRQVAIDALLNDRASRSRKDSVADGLVAIMLGFGVDENVRSNARATLALATIGVRGTAYAGGPERLYDAIDRDSLNAGGLIWALAYATDRSVSVPLMRRVATSGKIGAHAAIQHLALDMGPQGVAALRAVYDSNLIADPRAQQTLRAYETVLGWKAPPPPFDRAPGIVFYAGTDTFPACFPPTRSSIEMEPGSGPDAIEGVVIARNTGRPPEGVQVAITSLRRYFPADSLGRFRIDGIPHGEYELRARATGYWSATARVVFSGNTRLHISLAQRRHHDPVCVMRPARTDNIPDPLSRPPHRIP